MCKCKHCEFLHKIFGKPRNNRDYWLFTEIFVYLHNGKDYCNNKESCPTGLELTMQG